MMLAIYFTSSITTSSFVKKLLVCVYLSSFIITMFQGRQALPRSKS